MGPHVEAFEQAFAAWVGAKHAVMVNSGSSANLLAVEALTKPSTGEPEWQPGDEILVPAVSWSTTVWPLVQAGLVPVFVDSDPDTLAMDVLSMARMTSKRTKGAMLIHVLGLPASPEVASFCDNERLTLVEDCCEAFGARVGSAGVMATYSHFFSHQLSTMEGGTVTTDHDALADDLRSMRSHGWTRHRRDRATWEKDSPGLDPSFLFVSTGYNVRPLEVQGAIGCVQLPQAGRMQKEKRIAAETIRAALAPLPWLSVIGSEIDACRMNLPLLVSPDAPCSRDAVVRVFKACGVETRPIIAGNLLRHPVMRTLDYKADRCVVADAVMDALQGIVQRLRQAA
jgi:CDP-6-deoxy-D-xylo-4-hexulose-3-dehydrase